MNIKRENIFLIIKIIFFISFWILIIPYYLLKYIFLKFKKYKKEKKVLIKKKSNKSDNMVPIYVATGVIDID